MYVYTCIYLICIYVYTSMTNHRRFTFVCIYIYVCECAYVCICVHVAYAIVDMYVFCKRFVIDDSTMQHDVSTCIYTYIHI